jgi:phage terminase large subunit
MGLMKSVIIADSAEAKSIEEIKRLGVRRIKESIKGQGSVLAGIQKLQEYELIVDSGCSFIVEELENYSWKKDKQTNEYINTPEDKNNHLMDALRYSL